MVHCFWEAVTSLTLPPLYLNTAAFRRVGGCRQDHPVVHCFWEYMLPSCTQAVSTHDAADTNVYNCV